MRDTRRFASLGAGLPPLLRGGPPGAGCRGAAGARGLCIDRDIPYGADAYTLPPGPDESLTQRPVGIMLEGPASLAVLVLPPRLARAPMPTRTPTPIDEGAHVQVRPRGRMQVTRVRKNVASEPMGLLCGYRCMRVAKGRLHVAIHSRPEAERPAHPSAVRKPPQRRVCGAVEPRVCQRAPLVRGDRRGHALRWGASRVPLF